jgi:outer membrane protein OmpA-like peptidoglycan-associated protein
MACGAVLGVAKAEPLRVIGRGGVALPVGGYQADEFGVGAGVTAGVEYPFTPKVGLAAELGGVWLSNGEPPTNPTFTDLGAASQVSAALALHLRPRGTADAAKFDASAGWWGSASGGLAFTGGLQRVMADVAVGYDFFLDDAGNVGVGPMASLLHVFQPDSEARPEDANVIVLGVHALFDGVERRKAAPPKPPKKDFDKDGIADGDDTCPQQPEDKDTFEDDDGCPDPDNDQDSVLDPVDHCPREAEDRDSVEDEDGCPDLDNDKDGVPDTDDMCPLVAEDKDGFNDTDGCPDQDNDRDGIFDPQDLCINEPENMNGYADGDGCPDEDQVRVIGDKIILDEKVHFAVNMDVIRQVSHPLLGRVAKLLGEHPDYVRIEVQGHTDKNGDADRNRALSERRAKAVMEFLIASGIPASRLSYHGYGEDFPLLDKETEWALFMNRRVEFKITRDEKAINSALQISSDALDLASQKKTSDAASQKSPEPNPAPATTEPALDFDADDGASDSKDEEGAK